MLTPKFARYERSMVIKMSTTVTKTNPLGTERIGKLILTFAVPSIISMVVNALYNIVDQIFIGQGVGTLATALPMSSCR